MNRTWWRVWLFVVLATFARVLWEPIRDGRPRVKEWAPGLRPVAAVSGAAYAVAALLVLLSGWFRARDTLVTYEGDAYPSWGVTILLWLLVLTLALALTAALHTHPLVSLLVLTTLGLTILMLLPALNGPAVLVPPLAVLGLFVVWIARLRYRFAWFEFPLVLALVTAGVYVPLGMVRFGVGVDLRPMVVALMLTVLVTLASPALIMGGYTGAEIAVTLGEWLLERVRVETAGSRWRPLVLGLGLLLGGVFFVLDVVLGIRGVNLDWATASWIGGAVVVLVAYAAGYLMLRRRPGRPPSGPSADEYNGPAYVLSILWMTTALVLAVVALIAGLLSVRGQSGLLTWVQAAVLDDRIRALGRIAAMAWAAWLLVRARRRGERVLPVLLLVFLVTVGLLVLPDLAGDRWALSWSLNTVTACGVLLSAVLVVPALVRREGVERQLWILLLALLISAMVIRRELLSEPGSVVAGISGLAVLMIGLVWRVVTVAAITRRGSRWFPIPTRVLFYAANALLAAIVVAHVALNRPSAPVFDVNLLATAGTEIIGVPLVTGSILVALLSTIGLTRQRVSAAPDTLMPPSPPDEKTVIREPQP